MKTLIIIPAYNEEENIKKVVENIIYHFPQYDYIIVNLGIGGAVQAGYRYAKANDYDVAIQMDGDGQHDISYADQMLMLIGDMKADVVIGSRFLENKGFQSSGVRRAGIKILSVLIKICTGVNVNDVTSGFRAVNRKFIDIYSKDYSNDYPEPEAIVSAVMYGGKILEIPVVMNERQGGISSIKFWNSIYYMIKVSLAIVIRRISYGIRRK